MEASVACPKSATGGNIPSPSAHARRITSAISVNVSRSHVANNRIISEETRTRSLDHHVLEEYNAVEESKEWKSMLCGRPIKLV